MQSPRWPLTFGYSEVIHFMRGALSARPRRSSRCLLTTNLALFSGLLHLPIPLGVDLSLTPREHVLRRDVADGAVQADVVVMLHVALHQTPGIVQLQRRSRLDALSFERFVPTFDFPVGLHCQLHLHVTLQGDDFESSIPTTPGSDGSSSWSPTTIVGVRIGSTFTTSKGS